MGKPINELLATLPAWESAFSEDGRIDEETRITMREAFTSPDAPILFPKVLNRTLREAAEPQYVITPLLSTVRIGKARSMEFPAVNALQAAEIPEAQEYPEQSLVFAKQVEGKVSKKGLKLSFSDEVIADSMWDIVGLHVRAAGRAMARKKEQIALSRFGEAARIVFDNDDMNEDDTTGLGADGTANDSLTWDDVVDMAAVLMSENHVPTDLIIHPLMWSVFLKNAHYHMAGPGQASAWSMNIRSDAAAANQTSPLGLNVLVTPFVGFTGKTSNAPAKSDVFLIDRNEVGVLLVRDDLSTEEFNDPTRDLRAMKLRERYDIVILGDGEGITVAKNVSLARNYDIILNRELSS